MLKVVKVRIYPTQQQKVSLAQAFGTTRWVWNHFLALTNKTYKETGKGISKYDMIKELPKLKKQEGTEWLKETYSQSLQSVCLNLSRAFVNFFEKRAKYPRFKSKFGKQSLIYPQNVRIADNKIYFPKLDWIDAVIHRPIEGAIRTVTITKNCCDQYYASIMFECAGRGNQVPAQEAQCFHDGKEAPKPNSEGKVVGIDLGLTHFCITSDGSKFDNPKWINKHERNLKLKQQQLSRKQKGSSNRNKSRKKVARIHNKISRCREDFQHKLSRRIVNENQVLVLENLAIKNLLKNHCLAKAISQVGWGSFCTMLKYKAEQEGKIYIEVDRFFPSSKTCHVCLNQVSSLPLDIRVWTCNSCKTTHDRDINSAIALRDEGLRLLTLGTRDTAYCLPDVRPSSGGRKKSTTRLSVG
jgi:putative transposase